MKGKGRGRESVEKEFPFKEERRPFDNNRQFDNNRPVQKQLSADNARYQREPKNDRRNYQQQQQQQQKKHPEDRRRVENSKSATSRDALKKSNEALNYETTSHSPEPPFRNQQNFNAKTDKRDFRQNSEPRILPQGTNVRHNNNHNNNNNRLRDTRSMENSGWSSDKIQAKPPPGRRGSSNQLSKPAGFDSLPPRLQRKYYEQQMAMSLPPNTYIGTSSEEQWDGGSLSFMNNSTPNYSVQQQYPMPPQNYYPHYPPPQQWSQTIPSPKGRGKGRLRPEEIPRELQLLEQNHQIPSLECISPQDSRPMTPLKNATQSHENINHDRGLMPPPSNFPSRSYSSHDQVGSYEEPFFEYDSHQRGGYKKEYDNRKPNYDGRNKQWNDSRQPNKRNQYNKNLSPNFDKQQNMR